MRLGSLPKIVLIMAVPLVAAALIAVLTAKAPGASLEAEPSPTPLPLALKAAPMPSPTPPPTHTPTAPPTATPAPSPTPTKAPVLSRSIFVDQDAQVMHVYENGVEIKTFPCSTGLPEPRKLTPAWVGRVGAYVGTFYAYDVYADDAWYLFDYYGDMLIHSAPYTYVNGQKVYQELEYLGRRPSSHGCIRLRPEDARWLTQWNPAGVPIAITPLTRQGPW